jgi:hypothetical protein
MDPFYGGVHIGGGRGAGAGMGKIVCALQCCRTYIVLTVVPTICACRRGAGGRERKSGRAEPPDVQSCLLRGPER